MFEFMELVIFLFIFVRFFLFWLVRFKKRFFSFKEEYLVYWFFFGIYIVMIKYLWDYGKNK